MPFPTTPSASGLLTTTTEGSPRSLESALNPVPDKLVETWDVVKDDPKVANKSRGLDNAGTSSIPELGYNKALI